MLSKKNTLLAIAASATCLLSVHAYAGTGSPYFGIQMGGSYNRPGADIQSGATTAFSSARITTDTGLAGRVFAGYQLGSNLAVETGFTRFNNATDDSDIYSTQSHINIKTYAIDLVGKVIIPLEHGVSVYGKGGVAYENVSSSSSATSTWNGFTSSNSANQKTGAFLPTFGAGVSYDLTQNVSADLSWTRIQQTGNSNKIGSSDFVGLGLKYAIN